MFLQELNALHHDNIIRLLNVLKADNDRDIYLVFEYMGIYIPIPIHYPSFHRHIFSIYSIEKTNLNTNLICCLYIISAYISIYLTCIFLCCYKNNNNIHLEINLHAVIRANILEDVHKKYVMYQCIKAIHYMHSGDLLHRDMKPSNVLLNSDCHVKLCDFGLARSVADVEDADASIDSYIHYILNFYLCLNVTIYIYVYVCII